LRSRESEMTHGLSADVLKCPYCGEMLPSHRDLRVHVGSMHRDKVDDFMETFYGGRQIEVDFVTFMLQRAISDLTEELCERCMKCSGVCPISLVVEGFTPRQIVTDVQSGKVRDLLRSDVIWICTSCLACKDACPHEISPYDVVTILRNLSARIGYHFPEGYKVRDRALRRSGLVQEPRMVQAKTGERLDRAALGLPEATLPGDLSRFAEALKKLSDMRVII